MKRTINRYWVLSIFCLIMGMASGQYSETSSAKILNTATDYNSNYFLNYTPSNYVGFFGTVTDYSGDLNNNVFGLFRFKYFNPGVAIALEQYLNPFFNIKEQISYDWVQYESPTKLTGVDAQFLSANLIFKYKFNNDYYLREAATIAPFIEFGGGGTYFSSRKFINDKSGSGIINDTKLNILADLGLTFRLNANLNLELASKVYMPMSDAWDGLVKGGNDIWANDIYIQHSAGLVFTLHKSLDNDHDGVPDNRDDCPYTPRGVKVDSRGCPVVKNQVLTANRSFNNNNYGDQDSDGDGVPNSRDKCANTPINTKVDANGCPINKEDGYDKDSDGDGVPDSRDKCANTPLNTKVDENGCPENNEINNNNDKDSDGDGIPDRIDRCPFSVGPASNKGCPEVAAETKRRLKFATRGIYFQTAKSVIKPESYPMLDEITDIINQYPDYNLRLSGHTDDVGNDEYNRILSQNRVDQVKAYLTNKGIDPSRLEAIGYGKQKPIANNNSALGKALNRRVELELYLK